jgi:hypothetical protein
MNNILQIVSVLLASLETSRAIPWEEPLQTAERNVLDWYGDGATPTEAPKAPQNVELRREILLLALPLAAG